MEEDLTPEDMQLLGITQESQLEGRAVFLRMIYTNSRYAPKDKEQNWARIQVLLDRKGIYPEKYARKVATYCGDHYLLPTTTLGTLAQCRKKGHSQGDRHGTLNIK